MGCATSKTENKFNKDVCERRKILAGLHVAKNLDGIETNFQLAIERKAKKTYEVSVVKGEEKPIVKEEEEFFPIPRIEKISLHLILT